MSGDSGERLTNGSRDDPSMPRVLDIQMSPTTFAARSLRNFASALPEAGPAVEFVVKTETPIPIRALGPVLYVGDTPVTEVTEVEPNTYRFVAPPGTPLARDAGLRLSWTGCPPTHDEPISFRYTLHE